MGSTLNGGGKDRTLGKGHGTGALGPSGSSDSGSDVRGGPGTFEGDVIGLDESGTTSDADLGGPNAGPDVGDAELDSDSDRSGTGERRAAGRDPDEPADIDRSPDRIVGSPAPGMTGSVPSGGSNSGLATDRGAGTTGGGRNPSGGGATGGGQV